MMKKNRGFTLIELIVVITIIAVITVMGMVNYGVTNRKARDSKRIADIEKIRIALEMYRQEVGKYPADPTLLKQNYMSEIPKEPKNGNDYVYTASAPFYTYTIGTSMEDAGSTNTTPTGAVNYVVRQP